MQETSEIRALEEYCNGYSKRGLHCPFAGADTQLKRGAQYCTYIEELRN